jgi:hypothetical protein
MGSFLAELTSRRTRLRDYEADACTTICERVQMADTIPAAERAARLRQLGGSSERRQEFFCMMRPRTCRPWLS